jgi:hypothetical protein
MYLSVNFYFSANTIRNTEHSNATVSCSHYEIPTTALILSRLISKTFDTAISRLIGRGPNRHYLYGLGVDQIGT